MKIFIWLCVGWILGIVPAFTFILGYSMGKQSIVPRVAETASLFQNAEVAGAVVEATPSAEPTIIISTGIPEPTVSSVPSVYQTPSVVISAAPKVSVSSLWSALNTYRQQQGLSMFQRDGELCSFAQTRLGHVQAAGGLNHDGFNALLAEYVSTRRFALIGETLSRGYQDPNEVIRHWDESSSHKAILTNGEFNRACEAFDGNFAVVITGKK